MAISEEPHNAHLASAYWQEFYTKNVFRKGSTFCEFIQDQPGLPNTVIDIGCGQGRDSISFARSGRIVSGLDRSAEGILQAESRAIDEKVSEKAHFYVCDVSNTAQLLKLIGSARRRAQDENVLFYMRFFLHSIPEAVQDHLIQTLSAASKSGDVFAAEFRTEKDEHQAKSFGTGHYRRYQNAALFSQSLSGKHGWTETIFETESTGLSVYGQEDPVLYRVIATR